jgi:NTP pyrophosphatase (non-canonical NTP hydrolase)
MKEMQERVDAWIGGLDVKYFQPLEILAAMTEELGEIAKELNAVYGPKRKKAADMSSLDKEVGDLLFNMACLGNSLGLDLKDCFNKSFAKFEARDKERWSNESGLPRE